MGVNHTFEDKYPKTDELINFAEREFENCSAPKHMIENQFQ